MVLLDIVSRTLAGSWFIRLRFGKYNFSAEELINKLAIKFLQIIASVFFDSH